MHHGEHTAIRCSTQQCTAIHCVSTQGEIGVIPHIFAGTYLKHFLWWFLIHTRDMTHSQQREAPTHSCVWHEDMHFPIHMCDMTCVAWAAHFHSYVWHDSFTAKRCLCGGVHESGVRAGTQSGVIPLVSYWRRITLYLLILSIMLGERWVQVKANHGVTVSLKTERDLTELIECEQICTDESFGLL